jgi:hypothetical protein
MTKDELTGLLFFVAVALGSCGGGIALGRQMPPRFYTAATCREHCDSGRFVLARLSSRGDCSCSDSYSQRVRVVRR